MSTIFNKTKLFSTPVDISPRELRRLFKLSLEIADIAEDILELQGAYKKEFLHGLEKSLKEVKKGKVRKIESLFELQ